MDIGRLQSPEPGGRKDPKVESGKARDAKRLEGAPARSGHALEAQDSVTFSPEAIELRGEVDAFVTKLRQQETETQPGLDPQRVAEIRQKLDEGHYARPEIVEAAARNLRSGLHDALDGLAQ